HPLFRAILDDPDDDSVRLIYADFLEERGEPEGAEFIRVQIELARLPEGDRRRKALEERERTLLAVHEGEWAGPMRGLCEDYEFSRGFVELAAFETEDFPGRPTPLPWGQVESASEFAAAAFLARVEALARLAPLRRVELRPSPLL